MSIDKQKIDIFGIGNALVDTVTFVSDDFIREQDLNKGAMTLVDPATQGRLLNALQHNELELRSGGSAANTMFAVVKSGGSAFYTGKVARDSNGEFYRTDLISAGIHFDIHPMAEDRGHTGTCLVMTTPDAERTMCTHLGVSTSLAKNDIDLDRLSQSRIVYLEGYLWDASDPRAACEFAMQEACLRNVRVAYTFSDPFCVGRFRDDYRRIVSEYCDILFCNADEIKSFYETEDFKQALSRVGELVDLAFVTDGVRGAYAVVKGDARLVPGFPASAIDTNGAGDAFAGGVLYALAQDYSPEKSARWGNYLAAKVVQIQGPRLDEHVSHLVAEILHA